MYKTQKDATPQNNSSIRLFLIHFTSSIDRINYNEPLNIKFSLYPQQFLHSCQKDWEYIN